MFRKIAVVSCLACLVLGFALGALPLAEQWALKEKEINAKLKEVQSVLDVLSGKTDLPAEVKETVGQRIAGRYAYFEQGQRKELYDLWSDFTGRHALVGREGITWHIGPDGLRLNDREGRFAVFKPTNLAGAYEGRMFRPDGPPIPASLILTEREAGK